MVIWNHKSCPDGCGLNNVSEELVRLLETIQGISHRTLIVTSATRCEKYNAQIGGAPNSAHLRGLAVDIDCRTVHERWRLLAAAHAVGITRVGVGRNFVHLDVDPTLPKEAMWLY